MRPRLPVAVPLAVLLLVSTAPHAAAYQRPGRTSILSTSAGGLQGDDHSYLPDVSPDGRFVVFESTASNLVPGDDNGIRDVFLVDRATSRIERVTAPPAPGKGGGARPAVSADGRFVAFYSSFDGFVPADANGRADCFVKDRETGEFDRVSVATDGTESNGSCFSLEMSAGGRRVIFENYGDTLVPGDTNGKADMFVRDLDAGTTTRVSVSSDGSQGNDDSFTDPVMSADGNVVAFHSNASNLVPDDRNERGDVFAHDLRTGETERVSVSTEGIEGNTGSIFIAISGDGRHVAFKSSASNLVPNDANLAGDIFLRDLVADTTRIVSVSSAGAQSNGLSHTPDLSEDGRYVSFISQATNLVPDDTNGRDDLFVHDTVTGATEIVSVDHAGGPAGENDVGVYNTGEITGTSVLTGDAREIVFYSNATDLLAEPLNGKRHVYVRDRGPEVGVLHLDAREDGPSLDVRGLASFTGAVLQRVEDEADDASAPGGEAGGELLGAEITYQAEAEQLLVRLRVSDLPGHRAPVLPEGYGLWAPSASTTPAVHHGASFSAGDGVRWEIRATTAPTAAPEPSAQSFGLYSCPNACERVADLSGAIGVGGDEVSIAVPLAMLGLSPGLDLPPLTPFVSVGPGAAPGAIVDEGPTLASTIPAQRLEIRVTRGGEELAREDVAVEDGEFAASLPHPDPGRPLEVLATACLGNRCGSSALITT